MRSIAPQLVSDGAVVPNPEDVEAVLSPTLVQMKGKDGRSGGVMTSNLPMGSRDGSKNGAPVFDLADIAWKTAGDRFEVKDPVVPVSLPEQAGGTLKVGKDIALRLAEPGTTTKGSPDGEAVTYPSISTDTDMVVRSLPTGVQVGWLLRSPDANQEFHLLVDLKDGQTLRKSPNGSVQILGAEDMVVGEVATVTAADADHVAVPLTTTVKGDTIVYAVGHAAGEVKYPIVVDPQIADVHWDTGADTTQNTADGWFGQNTPSPNEPYGYGRNPKNGSQRGQLSILGPQRTGYSQTAAAAWARFAPGDQSVGGSQNAAGRRLSDEHGYWYRIDAGGLAYSVYPNKTEHYYNYPQSVVALAHRDGTTDTRTRWAFLDSNGNPGSANDGVMFGKLPNGTTNQSAAVWLGSNPNDSSKLNNGRNEYDNLILFGLSSIPPYYYWQYEHPLSAIGMGWYRAYASDTAPPKVSSSKTLTAQTPAAGWQDAPPTTVDYAASDAGVGVRSVRLETVNASGPATPLGAAQTFACDKPDANTFCRFTRTGTLDGSTIPDGRATARLISVDADDLNSAQTYQAADEYYQDNPSAGTLNFAVDTTDPDLTLSGDLFVQRDTTLPAGQTRALTVNSADGVPGGTATQQQSGVQRTDIYVDDELVKTDTQTQAGDSRGLTTTWTPNSTTFQSGDYVVRVDTYDRLGHKKTASFTVHAPCCGTPLGNGSADASNRLYRFGDVDSDGKSDLVLADKTTGALTVRIGAGDGTFGTESSWGSLGTGVTAFDVGDLTADSKADVAARATTGAILVRLSTGSTFGAPDAQDPTNAQTSWPATRSFNLSDTDGDLVADLWGVDSTDNVLYVAGGADNGFLPAESWITLPDTRKVDIADVDGDGAGDLVSYEPSSGVVNAHLSDGTTFGSAQNWGSGPASQEFTTGDINGDGLADAVFRDGASPGTVVAKETSVTGGFIAGQRSLGTLSGTFALQTSDLTGDGKADVVGTRLDGNDLVIRSVASKAPDPDEADPYPVTAPAARQAAAAAASGPRPVAMAQADKNLVSRASIGLSDADQVASFGTPTAPFSGDANTRAEAATYRMMRHLRSLGITRLRAIVWWGQVDRLRPGATTAPALTGGQNAWATGDHYTDSSTNTKVTDRWLWKPYDKFLEMAAKAGLSVHFTLSGGNRGFTECDRRLPTFLLRAPFSPRGCVGSGTAADPSNPNDENKANPDTYKPTGFNPSPADFDHFVAEAVYHFKSLPNGGNALSSIGLWNEPNLQTSYTTSKAGAFLSVANPAYRVTPAGDGKLIAAASTAPQNGKQKNTDQLYGKLYAAGYHGAQTALTSLNGPSLSIGLGEVSSGRSFYADGKSSTRRGVIYPAEWSTSAMRYATQYWDSYGSNPGDVAIADFFAVHPYQYTNAPWNSAPKYPFGVYGVGHTIGSDKRRSVKRVLSDSASDGKISSTAKSGTATGSAPDIWATEFGYFAANQTRSLAQSEPRRAQYLSVQGGGTAKKRGAFAQLADTGGVRVINMYQALESPPASATTYATGGDYGYIGSQPQGNDDPRQYYAGQLAKVAGTRPYAVGNSTRQVACEIRRFERDRGLSMTKSPFADPSSDSAAWPAPAPAAFPDAACPGS